MIRVKPFYTIAELASFCDYNRRRMHRFIKVNNIPYHKISRTIIVYLSDLQDAAPSFFRSIQESQTLNSGNRRHNDNDDEYDDSDGEDSYHVSQFK